jgi:hypothetical protein
MDILKESGENIDPAVMTLPALDLDKLLEYKLKKVTEGGHDVPGMSLTVICFLFPETCNLKPVT